MRYIAFCYLSKRAASNQSFLLIVSCNYGTQRRFHYITLSIEKKTRALKWPFTSNSVNVHFVHCSWIERDFLMRSHGLFWARVIEPTPKSEIPTESRHYCRSVDVISRPYGRIVQDIMSVSFYYWILHSFMEKKLLTTWRHTYAAAKRWYSRA